MKVDKNSATELNVVILGGSSGIGEATAKRFAKEGWKVFIASNEFEEAKRTVNNLEGEGHHAFNIDVRSNDQISALKKEIEKVFGTFQVLVNSVGISEGVPLIDSVFEEWNNPLQVILYGTVNACRALVPLMLDFGRIINITSIHYTRVEKNSSAYGMAKAAVNQFTRSLALELAPKNILANSIAPGFINTRMSIKADGKNELESAWFHDNYIKYNHLPLKRAGMPDEVAGVVYFLSGKDASYITGSVITVDGGLTITF